MVRMILLEALPENLHRLAADKWTLLRQASDHPSLLAPGDAPESQSLIQRLQQACIASDFFSRTCIRQPQLLEDLVDCGDLEKPYQPGNYRRKLQDRLKEATEENELGRLLRLTRQREALRIAYRDITGLADLTETMSDLSAFADACISEALARLHGWQSETHGFPTSNSGMPQDLVVIAMGKLGARELNFSSDIDLVFAYPEKGLTQNGPTQISNEEYFTRLGRRLMKVLGSISAEGLLFRVDMRLRPFGENGPLVMSFDNMEGYYQDQGREWERYAWIKARVVAGSPAGGCASFKPIETVRIPPLHRLRHF